MLEKTFEIKNKIGIHARPAAQIVKIASSHKCHVYISKDGREVNGKSIMGILTLEAGYGSKITIKCDGDDEFDAIEEFEILIVKNTFNED